MTGRLSFVVRASAMALVALVLAHNVIFLAGYGGRFGAAMARMGHDHGWVVAAAGTLALAGVLLLAGALRLRHLRRVARQGGARPLLTEPDRRAFLGRWLVWWIALTLATAVLFVIEENIEVAGVDAALPGLGVLWSSAYPNAVAVIAVVALSVSLVAAMLGWQLTILSARVRAIRPEAASRATSTFAPADTIDRRRASILGRGLAGRAPPLALAS